MYVAMHRYDKIKWFKIINNMNRQNLYSMSISKIVQFHVLDYFQPAEDHFTQVVCKTLVLRPTSANAILDDPSTVTGVSAEIWLSECVISTSSECCNSQSHTHKSNTHKSNMGYTTNKHSNISNNSSISSNRKQVKYVLLGGWDNLCHFSVKLGYNE